MPEPGAVRNNGHLFLWQGIFSYDNPDGGCYRAQIGASLFKSCPSDSKYGPSNPRMWAYGHAVVGDNTRGFPSFHAGSRRSRDPFSIPMSSLSHPRHVRCNVDPSPLFATPAYQLNSQLILNRWPQFRSLLQTDYPPQIPISVLFDETCHSLERAESPSRAQDSNSNAGKVSDPEREVSNLQSDINSMNRRFLRQ